MGVDVKMYVVFPEPINHDALRRLSWEMGDAFRPETFCPDLCDKWRGALCPVEMIDSEQLYPNGSLKNAGITPSRVAAIQTIGRYYGPDYARGPWCDYLAWRNWLVAKVPGVQVWYGDDSTDCVQEMTDQFCADMQAFFVESGHRTYFGPKPCDPMCPLCNGGQCEDCGGYGATTYYRCSGCGGTFESPDSGKTLNVKKETRP